MQATLSAVEKEIAKYLATQRKKANRQVNPRDHVQEFGLEANYIEQEGVMSEIAFCKMFNIYPEQALEIGFRSATAGQDNGDAIINGICIDVKTTKHQKGQLVCFRKNPAVDLVVLLTGERGCYRLAGGMFSEDIYVNRRWGIPDKMRQYCYSAVQEELLTPAQVQSYILRHNQS